MTVSEHFSIFLVILRAIPKHLLVTAYKFLISRFCLNPIVKITIQLLI